MFAAFRTAPIAVLTFAIAAAPVGAQVVSTTLHGTVISVPADAAVANQLAALGVAKDAAVTLDYSVDGSTQLGSIFNGYAEYPGAVTGLTLAIGNWQALILPAPTLTGMDNVQVGNDLPDGGGDSYLVAAPATDTDLILTGSDPGAFVGVEVIFGSGDFAAIPDDGVLQDVSNFTVGVGTVSGPLGAIGLLFDSSGGGGGGGGGKGPGLAEKGQLAAAAGFGKSLFAANAAHTSAPPEKDPFGAKLSASIDKAETKFADAFKKATDKAVKKGGTAPLPASEQGTAEANIEGNVQPLVDSVVAGVDADNKFDRALRGKLLKAAAAQSKKELVAFGANALKPDQGKLDTSLAKARAATEANAAKVIEAAAAQGVTYAGPDGVAIADAVRALTTEFNLLTQGIQPDAAGSIANASVNAKAAAGD